MLLELLVLPELLTSPLELDDTLPLELEETSPLELDDTSPLDDEEEDTSPLDPPDAEDTLPEDDEPPVDDETLPLDPPVDEDTVPLEVDEMSMSMLIGVPLEVLLVPELVPELLLDETLPLDELDPLADDARPLDEMMIAPELPELPLDPPPKKPPEKKPPPPKPPPPPTAAAAPPPPPPATGNSPLEPSPKEGGRGMGAPWLVMVTTAGAHDAVVVVTVRRTRLMGRRTTVRRTAGFL